MELNPTNVARWTPSPSPTRPLAESSILSDMLNVDGRPKRNSSSLRRFFPFNLTTTMPPSPEFSPPNDDQTPPTTMTMAEFEDEQIDKKGVSLTWKDVWVTADVKEGQKTLLRGLNGYAQPGEVLAIMGPSGCGKSTLLDALAGRLGSNTRQTGEIMINGRKQALAFGSSAYVTQDDALLTTLTVKEAVHYSAQLQLPDSMTKFEKLQRADETIANMGLQGCVNTRIGGWHVKGLSGGQKRRVSICIEILTRPRLLFLDEPTSGLDSAASYHIMSSIIKLAQLDRRTVVASIHQPSSEVFELFHNLCLLSSGRLVYFGPASTANEFFAMNGFPCPSLRNPSDHYLRTINKDFEEDIEEGRDQKTSVEEIIHALVKSYRSSQTYEEVQLQISKICHQDNVSLTLSKQSNANFVTQCLVLTNRSFMNMYRDLGYYWFRFGVYIALCLCIGTMFYDIGLSYGSIQARGSVLIFVAGFITFMAVGSFPSFAEEMKIFGRERLNGHYGVGAYMIGNTLSSIPYLLINSLIPGALAYYLVGLQRGLDHFAFFALVLFVCLMLVESQMMIVATIVPDFLMGIIAGSGIQGIMLLNGGFFRLPNDIPNPIWKYPMYYVSFHKYATQAFYKNEFEGLTFPSNQVGGPSNITGKEVLRNFWEMEMGYSKWVDLAILIGMIVFYRFMFWLIIKMTEKVKLVLRSVTSTPPNLSNQIRESS